MRERKRRRDTGEEVVAQELRRKRPCTPPSMPAARRRRTTARGYMVDRMVGTGGLYSSTLGTPEEATTAPMYCSVLVMSRHGVV